MVHINKYSTDILDAITKLCTRKKSFYEQQYVDFLFLFLPFLGYLQEHLINLRIEQLKIYLNVSVLELDL
jgi:hypothetical protein